MQLDIVVGLRRILLHILHMTTLGCESLRSSLAMAEILTGVNYKMGKLDNKIALITGGGSGIGRATSILFAREGASVALADWAEDQAKSVVAEITRNGGKAIALKVDVSKAADAERMVAQTIQHFGRLDILYNNAGIGFARPLHQMTEEEWDQVVDVDLKGVFLGCKIGRAHV